MIPTEKILKASDEYASGKSSSEVFSQAHKNDFLAGAKWYEENSKAPEMLELLISFTKAIPDDGRWDYQACMSEAQKLIKEATEL